MKQAQNSRGLVNTIQAGIPDINLLNCQFWATDVCLCSSCYIETQNVFQKISVVFNLPTIKKNSRHRPGVAQRVPGSLGAQISRHSAREGGEVVSLTHRPPLPPGIFLVFIFTRGWVDPRVMVRSEWNMSLKNPMTPPGIDPGTVRLVAQRLNHYATPSPLSTLNLY
jgi:hypothetical protein